MLGEDNCSFMISIASPKLFNEIRKILLSGHSFFHIPFFSKHTCYIHTSIQDLFTSTTITMQLFALLLIPALFTSVAIATRDRPQWGGPCPPGAKQCSTLFPLSSLFR